uniref:Prefoldin subunit 3 n=1 Tax=Albugo laibachii Nc14 TaxID=890382 RepID=F0WC98_9STRA|nr:prefoldin subunit 3 putative [Albugo laibachii Nc14]|eukprot:CCA18812.1 prefoldin subunit 3 putative [Albugo laibachii Nc14]
MNTSSAESDNAKAMERLSGAIIGSRNERGIPSAVFIEAAKTFLDSLGVTDAMPLMGAMQQLYSKYKFMEASFQKSRESLKAKLPDTEKDLEMLQLLMSKQEAKQSIHTKFNLADNIYVKAAVDPSIGNVCIWLGANVMVEFSYTEALELLQNNIATAKAQMNQIDSDLGFLRDQIITTEVNMARVYNYDSKRRRQDKTITAPAAQSN